MSVYQSHDDRRRHIVQTPKTAIIVGAGVVGMASAYCLARDGVAVTVVDRKSGPGQGASFANGAQLSYVYTDALASPALFRRIPALALGLDPAFRFCLPSDADEIRWLLAFLRNGTGPRFLANTIAGLQLGLKSQLALHALVLRHGLSFNHRRSGKLHVHSDAGTFRAAQRMVDLKRRHGAVQETLSAVQASDIEPALVARKGEIAGAILSPQEEVGDPHLFCQELRRVLADEYGVKFRFGEDVRHLGVNNHEASVSLSTGDHLIVDHVVVCAGAAARPLLRAQGIRSPLMPMKGYSFDAPPGSAPPLHSITDVARKLVFCQLGGAVRVAGLAELGARSTAVEPRRLSALLRSAAAALPQAADYARASAGWAGLRPMSPSSLPDVRQISPRLSINLGHGMLGWTYAMGTAERLSELITRRHGA